MHILFQEQHNGTPGFGRSTDIDAEDEIRQ
jgi:hypothetical protein